MADAAVTTTTAANFIPQVWEASTLDAIEFASVIQGRVVRDYEGTISAMGNTVNVPRLSNLTTQTKTAGIGNTAVFEAITEGVQQLQVTTHQYAAFFIEDPVEVQVNQDIQEKYTKKIGYALARGREVAVAGDFASLGLSQGTLNVPMLYEDWVASWQQLALAGLVEGAESLDDEFSIVITPQDYGALLKTDQFINRDYNPEGNAVQRARVGDLFGAPIFMSNLLTVDGSGHDAAMFHRGAMALAVQREVRVVSDYLIRNIGTGYLGWNLFGHTVLSYPPETPGGGTAAANRGVWLKSL